MSYDPPDKYQNDDGTATELWKQLNVNWKERSKMNLYLITRQDDYSYDEYSDAVVVAENENEACNIHPDGSGSKWYEKLHSWVTEEDLQYAVEDWWCSNKEWPEPDRVTVEYLGEATGHLENGTVVCASFHGE